MGKPGLAKWHAAWLRINCFPAPRRTTAATTNGPYDSWPAYKDSISTTIGLVCHPSFPAENLAGLLSVPHARTGSAPVHAVCARSFFVGYGCCDRDGFRAAGVLRIVRRTTAPNRRPGECS